MIDTRGYSCPTPVILVQKAIQKDQPDTLEVLCDDRCAVENITRLAEHCGYSVSVSEDHREYRMQLEKC